jgi:protein O-mannosyl-transferase
MRPAPARQDKRRASRANTWSGHAWAIACVLAVTALAFSRVLQNDFVNWDDPATILQNQRLGAPGVVQWAFTTTFIEHYQPLAWLAWSAVKTSFGVSAAAFHGISLIGHLGNSLLVYLVALRLTSLAGLDLRRRRLAALMASAVFAIHPLRVEAVAWASAFPYVLSLSALLLAFLAYLNYADAGDTLVPRSRTRAAAWLTASVAGYAASLLCRANAIGFPLVLLLVDIYPIGRRVRKTALLDKLPFLVLAIAAAVLESQAREIATWQEVGVGARLTMAVTAPFIYLARTFAPIHLSPLDPLPIAPSLEWAPLVLGVCGLAAIGAAAWKSGRRWPAFALAATAYAATLAPVAGLTPSGLQATADRYMYLPAVIVAILAGTAAARLRLSRRLEIAGSHLAMGAVVALGALTWRQAGWWHDSITLWTRAADLDPRNDIATYNLAIALAEAGREEEAISRYDETLRLVPDHVLARQNLTLIKAARAERDADRLAEAGRLDDASARYGEALALDARRLHARAARGIILMRRGRLAEAAAELRVAFDGDVKDPEVPNALAFALMQTGRPSEAVAVLKTAAARHPDDLNLAHNLARLLATAPDPQVRDGALALRMALEIRDRTGGRDPRVLDTLAAAYAAVGRFDLARQTASEGAARARQLGDMETADQIAAHAKAFAR